jgi:hypothetical protein
MNLGSRTEGVSRIAELAMKADTMLDLVGN